MKHLPLLTTALLLALATAPRAHATDVDPAKAKALLHQLQADLANVPTTGDIDLKEFPRQPVTTNAPDPGYTTYFRYGAITFRSHQDGVPQITPELDSVAIVPDDSLYLQLTVAPNREPLAQTHTFSLAPYLPNSRLYVYYRENLLNQEYQNAQRITPTAARIYAKISQDLKAMGVKDPQGH